MLLRAFLHTTHLFNHLLKTLKLRDRTCERYWSLTFVAIQSIKWSHPYPSMIMLFINNEYKRQPLIPRLLVFFLMYILKHIFETPIDLLSSFNQFQIIYIYYMKFTITQLEQRFSKLELYGNIISLNNDLLYFGFPNVYLQGRDHPYSLFWRPHHPIEVCCINTSLDSHRPNLLRPCTLTYKFARFEYWYDMWLVLSCL